MIDFKHLIAKITSLSLIGVGVYQILLSLNAIFFIYPYLNPQGQEVVLVQEDLVEKAIILYLSMITTGIYGVILLFKPAEEVRMVDLAFGILIFAASLFFTFQTPFTTDPLQQLLLRTLGK